MSFSSLKISFCFLSLRICPTAPLENQQLPLACFPDPSSTPIQRPPPKKSRRILTQQHHKIHNSQVIQLLPRCGWARNTGDTITLGLLATDDCTRPTYAKINFSASRQHYDLMIPLIFPALTFSHPSVELPLEGKRNLLSAQAKDFSDWLLRSTTFRPT